MSTNPAAQGRTSNVQERFQHLNQKVNTPMQCECGSTHFYVVRAEEFADNGYASAQIRSLSTNTEALYLCVCGLPVQLRDSATGKASDGPRGRFLKSLQTAIAHKSKNTPQGLAQGFVSLAEHEEVKADVATAKEQIEWLMSAVEALTANDEDGDGEGDEATGQGEGQPQETGNQGESASQPEAKATAAGASKPAGRTGKPRN